MTDTSIIYENLKSCKTSERPTKDSNKKDLSLDITQTVPGIVSMFEQSRALGIYYGLSKIKLILFSTK